jgi:hypothetical protein
MLIQLIAPKIDFYYFWVPVRTNYFRDISSSVLDRLLKFLPDIHFDMGIQLSYSIMSMSSITAIEIFRSPYILEPKVDCLRDRLSPDQCDRIC